MTILYDLCNRIVELRNKFGITQADLARRLGISRSAVNSWEMGLSIPQLKHVIEMARIFNTTVDGMLNTSEQVVVNITELSEKEQQVIFNMVDCLKKNQK
ncbi:MAG: helix-turn-helix transcriptional regulator [Oscillospiraceae bacterium]|nr:helix-turn-helix transcriptional regulator [Oscillospiraceae bacterium]